MKNDNEYFANWDTEDITCELQERLKVTMDYMESVGLRSKWVESYRLYFGKHFSSGDVTDSGSIVDMGQTGELKGVAVNNYRSIIKSILSMATGQKPAWQCRASNSDLKSLQQAKLGNQLLDSYMLGKRMLRQYRKAAESALVFGKGFVYTTWDKSLGKEYAVEKYKVDDETRERVIFEGDVSVKAISIFDYYIDPNLDDYDSRQWEVIRCWENRWDLIAKNPEMKDELMSIESKEHLQGYGSRFFAYKGMKETDLIPTFHFYHKRTDAVPNGRYIHWASDDAVFYDGPNPYDHLPVDRIVPGEIFDSAEGFTDAFSMMPLQNAMNVLVSSAYTNLQAFGTQQVLVPSTANMTSEQIGKGLSVLKYDPQGGKPEALQLTAMPQGLFEMVKLLDQFQDKISGQNAVARGDADVVKGMSGTALALVQSMAVQYSNAFQESWANLIEDGGTKLFSLLKNFANTERVAEMAGKQSRPRLLSFKGEDVSSISRVVVELGNPLTRTTSGRVQIAQDLMEKGLISTPQQYIQVLETGNLDVMLEGKSSELDLIRQENELFLDGKGNMVQAMVGDSHLLHAQEHRALLANPLIRYDEPIVTEILAHIQMHEQLATTQSTFWAAISGEPPMNQGAGPEGNPMPPPDMMAPEGAPRLPPNADPMAQPTPIMDSPPVPMG
jgi:hypothetical protein